MVPLTSPVQTCKAGFGVRTVPVELLLVAVVSSGNGD